jgi:cupin 2 domain-containing protein
LKKSLFDLSSLPQRGEIEENLLHYKNITIKRIVSSDRLEENSFCQKEAEWVVLLEGRATIKMQGICYNLNKGESLFIPPLTRHVITSVERGTIWLAVHIYDKEST